MFPPDPFHPLMMDLPSGTLQQRGDPTVPIEKHQQGEKEFTVKLVPVTPISARQQDDQPRQSILVFRVNGAMSLRRSCLPQNLACPALRNIQCLAYLLDTLPPSGQAYEFPRDASCRISLSRVRSDTALRSRAFSCSSSFNRLAWSFRIPP